MPELTFDELSYEYNAVCGGQKFEKFEQNFDKNFFGTI